MDNTSENTIKGFRLFSEHLMFLPDSHMDEQNSELRTESEQLRFLIDDYQYINPWYTPNHIRHALKNFALATGQIGGQVKIEAGSGKNKSVALLLRPGAPLEGLGEVLICAISGFHCLVSLKEEEIPLFRAVINLLGCYVNGIAENIDLIDGRLPEFDACIGVNSKLNSSVEKYFSRRPFVHFNSKGRSAILTGKESVGELEEIAEEICMYFGRSMHNVKTLFVPEGYDFGRLMDKFSRYADFINHSRYFNHYEYRKAAMLINQIKHLDNGFLLVTNDIGQLGFTGVLHFTTYQTMDHVLESDLLRDYPLANVFPSPGYTIQDKSSEAVRRVFGNAEALAGFLNSLRV